MKHFIFLVLILILLLRKSDCLTSETFNICLTNCVQCKQMFGEFFKGRACGDACIQSNGRLTPDCNNPLSIGNYLKRLY